MGKFQKGHKPKPREGKAKGGRPTREQAMLKKLAADKVKEFMEDHLRGIVEAYISAATGKPCGGSRRRYDNATNRHAIERFVGPAPRSLILDAKDTVESFFEQIMKEGAGKEVPQIEEQGKTEEQKGD